MKGFAAELFSATDIPTELTLFSPSKKLDSKAFNISLKISLILGHESVV